MRFLPAILANLLILFAILGTGSLVGPLLPDHLPRTDRFTAKMLAGIGLLGTLIFLFGQIAFTPRVLGALLVVPAMAGVFRVYRVVRGSVDLLQVSRPPVIPACVIGLVMAVTALGGLAEPVGDIKMDAIAYHYLGPHVWLRDAVIHVLPDECHASFPAIVETLYGSLIAIGGTRAPELFAVVAFGLLLLVSYGFAIRLGLDVPGAWWATALIATMPVVYRGSYGGFVDAIFSSFILLSLRFALDARKYTDYILSGLFVGFAMGTKYTGLPALVLILTVALVIVALRQSASPGALHFRLFLLAATAILIASPWYLRNWVVLGSPIYPPPPALLRIFHIRYMSPEAIDALAALIRKEGIGMGHTLPSFLLLPFHFTFHPANFLNGPGGVGITLLALAPFGLLLRLRDPFVGMLFLFSFAEVAGWFVTEQEARFLIHVYILLAIFAIYGWRYAQEKSPRLGSLLAGATVAVSILYGLAMIVPARAADLRAVFSPRFEEQRKSREIPYRESFDYLNADPTVKKVLVLEPRVPTFYLNKNYLKPIGRFGEQTVPEANDFAKLAPRLTAYGITHVLDVRLDDETLHIDFRVPPGQPSLRLVFEQPGQRVYAVEPFAGKDGVGSN